MKTIGLIGGTSWHSTIVYYRLINEFAEKEIGSTGNPPLLIYSLNVELMREHNSDKINATYLDISQKLQTAGAEAIVICANTPHMVYEQVQPQIDIPILHISDAIGEAASEKNLSTLGLLGTMPTMTDDFIKGRLKEKYGIDTTIPAKEHLDRVHAYIADELTQGKFSEAAKQFYVEQMYSLENGGAEGIILGCTELPLLLDPKEFHLPLMDTTALHARMAVNFIFSK